MDAYHDAHDSQKVASLPLKSGALQVAVAIDYPSDQSFDGIHIIYDGINGQLPNLDLINSIVNVAGGQMGMRTAIQGIHSHDDSYRDRLKTIFRGMLKQGLGIGTGPHSSFIPYHVDAVTLVPYGEGWQDEMAMGRVIEGTFRSLNNLLEHLHQSFFFYLLMQRDRFVSIGTYLPSAMLLAANFTIMAIYLWVKSGQSALLAKGQILESSQPGEEIGRRKEAVKSSSTAHLGERNLFLPLGIVAGCHAASTVPLSVFNGLDCPVSGILLSSAREELLSEVHACSGALLTLWQTIATSSRFCHFLSWLIKLTCHNRLPCPKVVQNELTAFPVDQVVLPSRPRHGVGHIGHLELLSRLLGGTYCQPFDVCATL